jgi:16S rRNA processing protein RimM
MAQKDTADTPKQDFGAFRRKSVAPSLPVDAAAVALAPNPASLPDMPDDLVEIGAIGEAYGIKGWVRIFAHAGPGQGYESLLAAKIWWLEGPRGTPGKPGAQAGIRAVRVVQSRLHSGTVVAQLEGITDRDIAQAMRGQRVSISRASFPALTGDEYYWVDLQGLDVLNEKGEALGVVADLIDNGVHSVLRVEFASSNRKGEPATGERMIPFVDAYVKSVDLATRKVVVEWDPAWDLETASDAADGDGPHNQ